MSYFSRFYPFVLNDLIYKFHLNSDLLKSDCCTEFSDKRFKTFMIYTWRPIIVFYYNVFLQISFNMHGYGWLYEVVMACIQVIYDNS